MTTRHLIADRNLSLLRDIAADKHIYSGAELVAVFRCEHLDVDYNTGFAVGNAQGVIPYFPCLFTEDCTQQSFLGSKLGFALGSYLSDKDIAASYLGTDSDNAVFVKILKRVFAYAGDILCDLLRTKLGVAALDLVFLDMDGGVGVVSY